MGVLGNNLPDYPCPCCGEHALNATLPDGPSARYAVECWACGVRLDHPDFDSVNGMRARLRSFERGLACEDWSEGGYPEWECSNCGARRLLTRGEPRYAFCPDCGAVVA